MICNTEALSESLCVLFTLVGVSGWARSSFCQNLVKYGHYIEGLLKNDRENGVIENKIDLEKRVSFRRQITVYNISNILLAI